MTTLIPLTRGLSALIDDDDYPLIAQYKWYAEKDHRTFYARTGTKKISMHRLILGAAPGQKVDHVDGNGLNNQRSNLRLATMSQNGGNQRLSLNNTSGFKGVTFAKREGRYQAALEYQGKLIWCGYHATAVAAARAYNVAAIRVFGEFAQLNTLPCETPK